MLFNSIQFLLFFPIVTTLYFVLPQRMRWLMLLVASCIFYMAWIPIYILFLFLIIGIDYVAGQKIEESEGKRRKLFLGISVAANVSLLAVFKYYGFITDNIAALFQLVNLAVHFPPLNLILPIGLSFHTFQALAYTIEVYKGKQKAEKHLGIYALYVMFYPQLVAGPIERPQHLIHQFKEEHQFDPDQFISGLRLMLWGFFKKLMVADRVAVLVNTVYDHSHQYTGIPLLLATYLFAYQIYCDFSGYTDIARGAARVMGINLIRNFETPYCATNIQEFWHRWHISLSTWFRDYLYIPLGGSKRGELQRMLNIVIVFFVSGLWHGANWTFAEWGLLHGVYMLIFIYWQKFTKSFSKGSSISAERPLNPLHRLVGLFITFNAVCFAWIFFRANSMTDASWVATHLFPLNNVQMITNLGMTGGEMLVGLISIIILETAQYVMRNYDGEAILQKSPMTVRWIVYYLMILSILMFGEFGGQRFIYFQF